MTDYTLSSKSFCRPVRSPWGAFPMRGMQVISTSPVLNVGRRVTLNYSANDTSVGQITPSTADNCFYLVGIAGSSASTHSSLVTGDTIPVWEANPNVEFQAVSYGATFASSHIGLRKKMVWDSTLQIEKIDLGASTATDWRVVITGIGQGYSIGDSGAYVTFKFLNQMAESAVTSVAPSTTAFLAFFG